MVKKVNTAIVKLWGNTVGGITWLEDADYGIFEYDPNFVNKGLDIAPIHMPIDAAKKGESSFSFPFLNKETFLGLPGLLADALPDKFGNAIINAWLARQGTAKDSFSPVERLCYISKRALGALEFEPLFSKQYDTPVSIEISELVTLAQEVMNEYQGLNVQLETSEKSKSHAFLNILRVGTSAGGARPKAVIAMDNQGHVLTGQAAAPPGYDYWILKFDGVNDLEMGEPRGYGRIEYAYYLMAMASGILMTECRLLEEHNRAHFMTKRFDRGAFGKKIHMQSLCGIAHYDFNMAGAYSYEQAFMVMRKLQLSNLEVEALFRRMVFNIIARNLDDHTKNISFLMDENGKWTLSPAYDLTFAHNPKGKWTHQHQMSVNGKRDHFKLSDLLTVAESISLSKAKELIQEVITAVENWPEYAQKANIKEDVLLQIAQYHRVGKNSIV
jgi:serine/threonine-protein kinase HipA